MDTAKRFAELSTATRAKVGAIAVKNDRIISIGYNGMPSGWDNNCEEDVYEERSDGKTKIVAVRSKPEVLHAETNCIAKLARSSESGEGASLFCTHMPCIDCAKLIYQSGITTVYYAIDYKARKGSGEQFLNQAGIIIHHVP